MRKLKANVPSSEMSHKIYIMFKKVFFFPKVSL